MVYTPYVPVAHYRHASLLPPIPHIYRITSADVPHVAALCPALFQIPFDTGFNLIYLPK
jgi:hypothetical protein